MCWRSWSRAGEQERSGGPSGSIHSGEFGFIPFLASVWVGSSESFDTLIFSGTSHLGRAARQRDAVFWQMSGTLSNFRPGHQNGLGIECSPEAWRAARGSEKREKQGRACTPGLPAGSCSPVVSPFAGSPTFLISQVVNADG